VAASGAVVLSAVIAAGCGGTESTGADAGRHRLPGAPVSVELPEAWDSVTSDSPDGDVEAFQRAHPRFLDIGAAIRAPGLRSALAAATGKGDDRLLVSVRETPSGRTLESHMRENLEGFETFPSRLELRVEEPRDDVVDVGAARAWRLRWSVAGDLGRVQIVQYTFVHDGMTVIFTYSTLRPWAEVADVFDASARSIRFDAAPGETQRDPERGSIAFHVEADGDTTDIYVVDAGGGEARRLTTTGSESTPVWSPDGTRIAFVSRRDGDAEIYVMRADGSDQRRLTDRPGPDDLPSWSPDGTRLLFTSGDCDDGCDLFSMGVDGDDIRQVTTDGTSADGSWSPDGEQIVLWSGSEGSSLVVMDADGDGRRVLTPGLAGAWSPDWSPDGHSILFASTGDAPGEDDERPGIYRIDAAGGDVALVSAATGFWVDEPEWSPDGESIAFFSDGGGPGAVWVADADGGRARPLTRVGDGHAPSWTGG
jgi:TolB protein